MLSQPLLKGDTIMRLLTVLSLMLLLNLSVPSSAQGISVDSVVVTEKDAYSLLPPELITAQTVVKVLPSANGRHILIFRENRNLSPEQLHAVYFTGGKMPLAEYSLVLWNSSTRTSRILWRKSAKFIRLLEATWIPKTTNALVHLEVEPETTEAAPPEKPIPNVQLLVSLSIDQLAAKEVDLRTMNVGNHADLYVSPLKPIVLFQPSSTTTINEGSNPAPLMVLTKEGKVASTLFVPDASRGYGVLWNSDGDPIVLAFTIETEEPKNRKWYAIDFSLRKLVRNEGKPKDLYFAKPDLSEAFQVSVGKNTVQQQGVQRSINTLWLTNAQSKEKENVRVMVCGDGQEIHLLNGRKGVIYVSQGAVWYRSMMRMDRVVFEKIAKEAKKTVSISNARQLGTALMMLAVDNDETLPDGTDINAKIGRYIKNPELLNGFEYTFGGGRLADILSPAETQLGFVPGLGGKAIIFADGHVRWENNP